MKSHWRKILISLAVASLFMGAQLFQWHNLSKQKEREKQEEEAWQIQWPKELAASEELWNLGGRTRNNLHETDQWTIVEVEITRGVEDDALDHIQVFSNLQSLRIGAKRLTPKGWAKLERLSKLRDLNLYEATDETLVGMPAFPQLKDLNIRGSTEAVDQGRSPRSIRKVTDEGLKHLQKFTSLQTLELSYAAVTDDGLKYLLALPNLRTLRLIDTDVTEQGAKQLRAALPKTLVICYRSAKSPRPRWLDDDD